MRKFAIYLFSTTLAFITPQTKVFADATAIGIDTDVDVPTFASKFATVAIGVAGGVAFLMMIYGSFRLIFSNGDPEAIQHGKQTIVAAITGLVVVVFSIFILRLIGISVLGLSI